MKKLLCLLLVILMLLTGCGKNRDDFQAPVNFYYCNSSISYNSEAAVLSAEVREGADHAGDLKRLIDLYLKGPVSTDFRSPFPAEVYVESVDEKDQIFYVVLSAPFAELKGLDLTVACACLTKTIMELAPCSAVNISVSKMTLDGSDSITMDSSSVLLLDESF